MKRSIVALIGLALCVSACSDPKLTRDVLTQQGYHRVETTGYRFFNWCEKNDLVTEFNATSPAGQHVTGVVCSHWLFGAPAIRFD